MLIFLTTHFWPIVNADGYCIQNILDCVQASSDKRLTIVTTGHVEVKDNGYKIVSIDTSRLEKKYKNSAKNLFIKLLRKSYQIFYWPDLSLPVLHKLIKKVEEIASDEQDNQVKLITFSGDIVAQLAGLSIKNRRPGIYWETVLFDPLPDENVIYTGSVCLYRNRNTITKNILALADDVFMTKGIFDLYCNKFPAMNYKFHECGLPLIKPGMFYPNIIQKYKKIELLYCGSINLRVRNLEGLVVFLKQIKDENLAYHLTIAGEVTEKVKRILQGFNISFVGFIEKKELVLQYYRRDVIFLCLGNNNQIQTPSKLVEYISTGKKIISIETIEQSQSEILLQKYPKGFIVHSKYKLNIDNMLSFLSSEREIQYKEIEDLFFMNTPQYNFDLIIPNDMNG